MAIFHATEQNFSEIRENEKPVLLDFYADWCGPCKMLAPILEELSAEREDVLIAKVNVDEESALAAEFGVVSIPTLIVLKSGEEVRRSTGARPKAQLLKLLED